MTSWTRRSSLWRADVVPEHPARVQTIALAVVPVEPEVAGAKVVSMGATVTPAFGSGKDAVAAARRVPAPFGVYYGRIQILVLVCQAQTSQAMPLPRGIVDFQSLITNAISRCLPRS